MSWGSTAPAAMAGLAAALGGLSVRVLDGPVAADPGLKEAVTVGWQDDTTAAVDAVVDPGVHAADRETYTINNAVMVLKSKDIVAARVRAFEIFGQVGALIKADRTLGGAVMRAAVVSWSLSLAQGSGGALATILFGVGCDAYTTE